MGVIADFHGVEQLFSVKPRGAVLLVGPNPGPRVRKILAQWEGRGWKLSHEDKQIIEKHLGPEQRYRGFVVLWDENDSASGAPGMPKDLFVWISTHVHLPSPILFLDGITDVHNAGAIIRSARAFGCAGVCAPSKRSVQLDPGALSATSAGHSLHLPLFQVPAMASTVDKLKELGYWIYSLDMEGRDLRTVMPSQPWVLIAGNEEKGVSNSVLQKSDEVISIKHGSQVESLNVSVATALALYQLSSSQ